MIILLRKSELFIKDPDVRFSINYGVQLGVWKELWRRYKLLEYSISDLREYFTIKTGKKIAPNAVRRWIFRTEVFSIVKPLVDKGVSSVDSTYFKQYEHLVIAELLKHVKSGDTSKPRVLP